MTRWAVGDCQAATPPGEPCEHAAECRQGVAGWACALDVAAAEPSGLPLDRIAELLGVGRTRAHQIAQKALRKLATTSPIAARQGVWQSLLADLATERGQDGQPRGIGDAPADGWQIRDEPPESDDLPEDWADADEIDLSDVG